MKLAIAIGLSIVLATKAAQRMYYQIKIRYTMMKLYN